MTLERQVNDAMIVLSERLAIPCDIITVHRDHFREARSKQFASLRYASVMLTATALDGFFTSASGYAQTRENQTVGIRQDRVQSAFEEGTGLGNVPSFWNVRTRVAPARLGIAQNRSPWEYLAGDDLRTYLDDLHSVRNALAHGDPRSISNNARTFFPLKTGAVSIRLMNAEGFIQAAQDLASQTAIALLGKGTAIPEWPQPRSSDDSTRLPQPY
jgi:hypothetical protein